MLARHSLIFGITILIKGLLSFATIAVFTRLLNVEEYGVYAIIIAIVSFLDVFGFMWLRHALMRHITDKETETDETYFNNTFMLYMIIAVVCAALGHFYHPMFGLVGFLAAVEALSNLVILMTRIRLSLKIFVALNLLKPLIALALGAYLIKAGFGVDGALWALLAACILASIIGIAISPDFKSFSVSTRSQSQIRAILAFGLPLIAALGIQSAIQVTDRLLLGAMIGEGVTGLYAAAQDIPNKILIMIASAIHMAAYPLAVKALDHEGQDAARTQLRTNITALWAILCPAACALAVLSAPLTTLFLGQDFRPFAAQTMPLFAAIAVLNCVTQYYVILAFNLAKRTALMTFPFLLALLLNAGIGIALIPSLGAMGAIWGSAAAYGFLFIAAMLVSRKIFPMPVPLMDLTKITLAALIMSAVLMILNSPSLLLNVPLGLVIYAAALWLLNPASLKERVKSK